MQENIIDLQPLFGMSNENFVKFLKDKCFDIFNAFLKAKANAAHDPLFVRLDNGEVRVGYIPQDTTKTNFFSDESVSEYDDAVSKICIVQFVIFEACKAYDCFTEVPMVGAPEEDKDAFFFFTHMGEKYTFKLWTKQ